MTLIRMAKAGPDIARVARSHLGHGTC